MITTNSDKNAFTQGQHDTDWHWADPVPLINQKFGTGAKIIPTNSSARHGWNDEYLNEAVIENSVIYLHDGSTDAQIKQLFKACERTAMPRVIVTDSKIRSSAKKPDNVHLVYSCGVAYQYSKMFDDSGTRPLLKRRVTDLKHSFLIFASNPNQHKGHVQLLSVLQELGALKNALYSSPEIRTGDFVFVHDKLWINKHMKNFKKHALGGEYIRFDHRRNLVKLVPLLNECHFHVAKGHDIFDTEYENWGVDEKNFQGFTTTCPVLPIWSESDAKQMQEWGFKFKNIERRRKSESQQDAIIRWCGEILFYNQIGQNKDWAQSWQDAQAEDAIYNFELLKGLHRTVYAHIEKQIDQLPKEFQNL